MFSSYQIGWNWRFRVKTDLGPFEIQQILQEPKEFDHICTIIVLFWIEIKEIWGKFESLPLGCHLYVIGSSRTGQLTIS